MSDVPPDPSEQDPETQEEMQMRRRLVDPQSITSIKTTLERIARDASIFKWPVQNMNIIIMRADELIKLYIIKKFTNKESLILDIPMFRMALTVVARTNTPQPEPHPIHKKNMNKAKQGIVGLSKDDPKYDQKKQKFLNAIAAIEKKHNDDWIIYKQKQELLDIFNKDMFPIIAGTDCDFSESGIIKSGDVRTEKNCMGYSHAINKASVAMFTAYETNIKQNYASYLLRYIQTKLNEDIIKKGPMIVILDKLKDKKLANKIREAVNKGKPEIAGKKGMKRATEFINDRKKVAENDVIADLLFECIKFKSKDTVPKGYEKLYDEIATVFLPTRDFKRPPAPKTQEEAKKKKHRKINADTDTEKGSLDYDLACNPWDYFIPMLKISKYLEPLGVKMTQTCPLKSTEIPGHITIQENFIRHYMSADYFGMTKGEVKNLGSKWLWNKVLNMDDPIFKHMKSLDWEFYNTFQTDGISCTLTFAKYRRDANGKKINPLKNIGGDKTIYASQLSDEAKKQILDKSVLVAVDPGVGNLAFLAADSVDQDVKNHEKHTTIRYTQKQRAYESESKIFSEIQQRLKNEPLATTGKTVIEEESYLTNFNSMTVDYKKCIEYIRAKVLVGEHVRKFYQNPIFRKFKLRKYINSERSINKFIKNIKDTYKQKGKRIVLGYGDWSRNPGIIKGCAPSMGVGLKRKLEKHFDILFVNEAYTSMMCNRCHKKVKNHVVPLKNKPQKTRKTHRVLVCNECTGSKSTGIMRRYINRDRNAALNILNVFKAELNSEGRPEYLQKPKTSQDVPGVGVVQNNAEIQHVTADPIMAVTSKSCEVVKKKIKRI